MRLALVLCCLLPCLAWAQPTPTASSTPLDEKRQALSNIMGKEEENEAAPSAKDQTKPAVFNMMIAEAQRERAGIGIPVIARKSIMPWIFSLILLPVYLHIARRRGFKVR
ncbi:hypothetical protein JST97_08900 [bacterium]|nr:hypothetical protein [bacterium]